MTTLCLHSLRSEAESAVLFSVSSDDCSQSPLLIWLDKEGRLRFSPPGKPSRKCRRIANLLFQQSKTGNAEWLLSPLSGRLIHNGIRPLPLANLEPGDVLAFEDQSWLTSELWRPAPIEAPEDIAEKECSVCGAALNLATVIQCVCGRFYHLENPEQPDDPEALNCYLSARTCGLCSRESSLAPQFHPVPPEELIPHVVLEAALASV